MALFGKKNANYISAKETKRISKENRKITNEIEKKRNRKNIPESEYITTMKNPENTQPFYWKFRLSENRAAAGSTYGCFCQDKRSGSF